MTEAKKNRSPGRPALPMTEKKARNFTFRSRGDMHERLSEAAAADGRSISEEIEVRLVQSFEMQERMAAFREQFEKRVEGVRQMADEKVAEAKKSEENARAIAEEAKRGMLKAKQELDKEYLEIERELEKATTALQFADALLGDDKQKSELLRRIVIEIARWPENWAANPDFRERLLGAVALEGQQ